MLSKWHLLIIFPIIFLTAFIFFLLLFSKFPSLKIPSIPFLNQKPFPETIGDLKKDGIVLHNLGNNIGVVISDKKYFQEKIVPLIKKYRPKGVEFFFRPGDELLQEPKEGYRNVQWIPYHLGSEQNSFLQDTGVFFAERISDGALEIHYQLKVTNQNPSQQAIRQISYGVERAGIIRYIWGDDNLRQPDIRALEIELTNRVVAGGDPVFKLRVKTN